MADPTRVKNFWPKPITTRNIKNIISSRYFLFDLLRWNQGTFGANISIDDFTKLFEFLVRFDQYDAESDLTSSDKAIFEFIISQIGHTKLIDSLLEVSFVFW